MDDDYYAAFLSSLNKTPDDTLIDYKADYNDPEFNISKAKRVQLREDFQSDKLIKKRKTSPSSAPFSKCATQYPPPPQLAHTKTSNYEPIELSQPSTFTNLKSVSNKDTAAVVTPDSLIEDDAGKIALRTRSKLPLTDTSITEIESTLVAPDIATDMCDNSDDADYAQFLSFLNKAPDDPMIEDDADANDPEFNCNSKAHVVQLYKDSHFDKSPKNKKKEKTELREELINLSEVDDLPYQVAATASVMIDSCKMQPGGQASYSPVKATAGVSLPVSTTSSSCTYTRDSQPEPSPSSAPFSKCETQHPPPPPPQLTHTKTSNYEPVELSQPSTFTNSNSISVSDTAAVITPEHRALINDNMRKHIQLLLQSYMLCQNSYSLEQETTQAKSMIEELNHLRQRSCAGEASTFNVYNLDPAVELLSKPAVVGSHMTGPVWDLSETQKLAIINSPAFIYPHLLPVLTQPKSQRKYNIFSRAEDNLIAFGLEKFGKCKDVSPAELIHQHFIHGKTLKQVFHRIQFMSSGKVGDNPIKEVKRTGKLPADFPKPTIHHFYTMAPKDQISDLLPPWVRNTLFAWKAQSKGYTNLSQPAFTSHLSQQQVSGMSNMSIQAPHERVNHMQQTTPSQIQPLVSIPAGSLPVTFQTTPALQLPTGLPPIAGLYIQFSAPAAAGPPTSSAITFPSLLPCTSSAVLEPTSRGSHNMKKTKRKITAPSSNSGLKKQKIQAPIVDEAAVSDSYTQEHQNISPDLLAKTMLSCGIGESPTCPSPQSQCQYSQHIDQLGMSFTSSTPIAQDKHPSVRNLNWEFDATHRQTFHNVPAPQIQNTEETNNSHSKSSCSQVSACRTVVSQNKTAVTTEPRSHFMSPLHRNVPDVNGEPQKEEARLNRDSEENLIPYTNSLSVTNHHLPGDISKHTTASAGSDFNDSFGETSQGIFSSDLPLNSDMLENKKQSPTIVGYNSQEYELPRENQKFRDLSPQSHLLTDVTFQSQADNVDVVDSGLASDCTNQTDKGTCETVQVDQSAQSGINLSVQNDTVSLNSVTEACEIAQDDRSPQSGINLSVKDDKEELTNVTETNSINVDVILPVLTDDSSSSIDETLTRASENISDSSNSDTLNNSERQTQSKPKTIRQILKESEKNKHQTTTSTSIVVPESNCVTSGIVNQNTDTIIIATDNSSINKPEQGVILVNDNSASSSCILQASTKHKELKKHVHQTVPIFCIVETESPSPTQTAAQVLMKKTTVFCQNRSPVKLLPKQPQTALSGSPRSEPLLTPDRMFTQKTRGKNTGKKICQETTLPVVKDPQPNKEKAITVEPAVIETEDAVLSQEEKEKGFESDDQLQLDDLKAASTTTGYDPKKGSSGADTDNKSKAQKKDVCLSMLEPDIIDRDSKKDESHTAYAQHYFTNIKHKLSDDTERFKKFLTILHDVNKNHMNPVELYADMATLLSHHQDLVDDFAGFLLSFQAVECNCFVSDLVYQQLLTFLKRLKVFCDNSSKFNYQQSLKMMSRWLTVLNQESQADATPFKEKIAAVLRHVPNVMDDLQSYFFGTPLPDSHPVDFEKVNLDEEAMADVDEFEETTLPEGREDYNTKLCNCQCHQNQQDEKLHHRIKHCYSCSLKDTISVNTLKQEASDLKSMCAKPSDDQYKTTIGELTEIVADVSGSSSAAIFSIGAETPVTMENLPETLDVSGQHDQPDFGYAMSDDRQSYSTKETDDDFQYLCPQLNPSQMLLDDEPSNLFVLSEWTEEQDRSILNVVAGRGVTQETVRKLHSEMPTKSVEEINSRARLLLQMLEQMGDTESDTDTDTSHSDPSE